MTRAELRRALQESTTVPFPFACRALGVGLTAGRAAERRGDFPVRVIRIGTAMRVVSAELEQVLLAPATGSDEARRVSA